MIKLTRPIGLSAVAALLAVTGLGLVAPHASAAPCSGTGCNGKNPESTGCSKDGQTMKNALSGGWEIDLRYSKTCKAMWVRGENYMPVRITAGHYDNCGSWVTDKSYKSPNDQGWFLNYSPYWEWTPMVSSSYAYYRMYDYDGHYWRVKNPVTAKSAVAADSAQADALRRC